MTSAFIKQFSAVSVKKYVHVDIKTHTVITHPHDEIVLQQIGYTRIVLIHGLVFAKRNGLPGVYPDDINIAVNAHEYEAEHSQARRGKILYFVDVIGIELTIRLEIFHKLAFYLQRRLQNESVSVFIIDKLFMSTDLFYAFIYAFGVVRVPVIQRII